MITRTTPAIYKNPANRERWALDPDKHVSYIFDFKGIEVKPGMQFKIKNERTTFTFICLVHNIKIDTTWIECQTPEGFRAVRPEKITKLVGIKKSYRRK